MMKDMKVTPGLLKKGLRINKRFYIVLICFSIAAIFWLLLALSHDYPTTITFPVRYVNLPGKKILMNELPSEITVQLKTSGFKILSLNFQNNKEPIEVDISENLQSTLFRSDILSISTNSFLPDFSKELGKEITITGFLPDSIVFNFSDVITKRVVVNLILQADFERQYDTTGPAEIYPRVVDVSGPVSEIEKLNSVNTESVVLKNLKETVKMKVKLNENRLLSYNVDEVNFTLPVEKFTEGSASVEINTVNVKEGFSLKTFPDHIKVRYTVALSHYNHVDNAMFDAVVDAYELVESHPAKLDVKLITKPSFVRVSVLEPSKVDYILRKQ